MSRAIIPNLRGLNNHPNLLMMLWIRSQDVLVWAVLVCSHSCGYNRVSDRASAVFRVPLARASTVGHSHGGTCCWLLASSSNGLLTRVPPHSPATWQSQGPSFLQGPSLFLRQWPKRTRQTCMAFQVTQPHLPATLVASTIASSRSRGKEVDPICEWKESQRPCGHSV